MSPVVLLGKFQAQPGRREELLVLLTEFLSFARSHEPGVEAAFFHRSPASEDEVISYERFASDEAFADHRALYESVPEYGEFRVRLQALLAAPLDVQRLDLVSGFAVELTAP